MTEESNSSVAENTNEAAAPASVSQTEATAAEPLAKAGTPGAGGSEEKAGGSLFANAEGGESSRSQAEGEAAKASGEEEKAAKPEAEKKHPEGEPEGAPEAYEDFKIPEGFEIGKGVEQQFKSVAKTLDLPQAKAQTLVSEMIPALAKRQAEQIQQVSQSFIDRTMGDPEIGGTHWQTAQRNVARIRDLFGKGPDGKMDPDIQEFLNSPMGNHPGVLKLFARAGKAFGEGGFPRGRGEGVEKITARDIYRNTKI